MTTEIIDIVVRERGAEAVSRKIRGIGNSSKSSGIDVDKLTRLLQLIGGSVVLRSLQRTVDLYTNMQNRLKLVTAGTEQLATVTDRLFVISNATRSSFESTAEVYARTALATKELGLSQEQTLQFTESLNQAVILSGASAAEASAGMIQLSQGLASGTLRGDELRSVLEQLPMVADVISKHLGVTRGELRKMGEEGRITAKDIIAAFAAARTELADKFGKTVPTIGQAFVVLHNRIVQYVGAVDAATGSSAKLASLILFISEHIQTLVIGVAGAVAVFVAYKAAILLAAAATLTVGGGIGALLVLFTGPVGIIAALGAAAVATAVFSDELTASLLTAIDEVSIGLDKLTDKIGQFLVKGGAKLFGVDNSILDEAIKMQNEERERASAAKRNKTSERILGLLDGPKKANADLTETGIDISIPASVKKFLEDQEKLLKKIKGPQLDYNKNIKILNALLKEGKISQDEYKAATLDLEAAVAATSRTMEGGLRQGIIAVKEQFTDMASIVKDTLVNAFQRAEDALVTFVTTGKFAFKDFARSVLEDLARIAIRKNIIGPIADAIGLGSSSGGDGGLFGGAISSGIGSILGNFSSAPASGIGPTLPGAGLLGGIQSFFGFANGGEFRVGGTGGTDSQLVAFRASPDETVSITRPDQRSNGGGDTFNFHYNIDASGGENVEERIFNALENSKPFIVKEAVAAVRDGNRRNPAYLGTQ